MNTSTIAIIFGTAIASAGITYVVTTENAKPLPADIAETNKPSDSAKNSTTATPQAPTPKTPATPRTATPNRSSQGESTVTKPEGITDEAWESAQRNVRMITGWANRARESGWLERRMQNRVERDVETITTKLGLEEADAEKVQELLSSRMDDSTERTNKIFDAMLGNEEGLTTLLAIREMSTDDVAISADLLATKEAYKEDMFGEFYGDKQTLSDEELMGLLRPRGPEAWYTDDDFLVSASSELGGDQAASLVEYAGKMDFLDRQNDASNKVTRIERTLDLQPEQSTELKKLYIDNPSPTDEQISQIVGESNVEAVKSSSTRRNRGRGRGRR